MQSTAALVASYWRSLVWGLRRYWGFAAWRELPGNLRRAWCWGSVRFCLKAGAAAVLADAMATWAGLQHGLWAPMSTLIVMQAQMSASLEASLMQLMGTLVGGVVGLAVVWLTLHCGLGLAGAVFLVGVAGAFLQVWDARFRLAGITAILILLLGGTEIADVSLFAMDRVLEIALGILSALLVSTLLWPHSAAQELDAAVHRQFAQAAAMLEALGTAFVQRWEHAPTPPPPDLLNPLLNAISANTAACGKVRDYEASYARAAFPHLPLALRALEVLRLHLVTMLGALQAPLAHDGPPAASTGTTTPPAGQACPPLTREVHALINATAQALRFVARARECAPVPLQPARNALQRRLETVRTVPGLSATGLRHLAQDCVFCHGLCRIAEEVDHLQAHAQHLRARGTGAAPGASHGT